MPRRLQLPLLLTGAGAAVLLVSLFADWYDPGRSAWDLFELVDLALAAIAVLALRDVLSGYRVRLSMLGAVAFVLVLGNVLDPPPAAGEEAERALGAWLALAGATLMLAGALLSLARVTITVSVAERAAEPPVSFPGAAREAREAEPIVESELYPERDDGAPLGARDPETGDHDSTEVMGRRRGRFPTSRS